MVNAQPCTMGEIIDCGVGIATKSSPRSQAIEKVQEELREKYNVRGERWRELEFLEKGGNPLDFEFAHVATASVPSVSLTDQIARKNVVSEAKGSISLSPRGDSLESNDRPGSSLCRETDTADDGGKSDILEDQVVTRGAKRLNVAKPKQSVSTDSNKSARKTEDSGLSRLVMKSQAYVRRNRSKPSRESANVSSIGPSMTPAKGYKSRDEKGGVQRIEAHEPDSSKKLTGSYSENTLKNAASDNRATVDLDGFQNVLKSDCMVRNESKAEEVGSVETLDANSKVSIIQCDSSASTHGERESSAGHEKADNSNLDKCVGHIHVGELDKKRIVPVCAVKDSGIHQNAVDSLCEDTKFIVDNHVAEDINLVETEVNSKSNEDLDNSRHSDKTLKESGQTEGFIRPTPVKVTLDLVQPESSNVCLVKDAMEVCDRAIVAEKDNGCPSSGHKMNIEGSLASNRKNDYCLSDPIFARPTAIGTNVPKNHEPGAISSLKSDEPNVENEIKKSENLDKMAKKAYEDSILRDSRIIEENFKMAGERLLCNTSLETRRNSHWDFVLKEMSWLANDFMQERLWKNEAASNMCHWVASDGRAKFEEANVQRKQKMIMKSLVKGVMSFWRSAEAGQTACRTAMMQEHNSSMVEIKASEIKTVKEHGNKSLGAGESLQTRQSQIRDYAVRFLEYNYRTAEDSFMFAESPPPDRLNDFSILKVSDQLTEESLFYTVASGAMVAYRESVESLFEYHKRAGNTELMDEYEASVCHSAADFPRDVTYEEDEGETCTNLSPASGFISKMYDKKKHQMHQRISGARQYRTGTYMPYEPCLESKSGNRPLLSNGKRSFLAVPAKRSRTAARQQGVSPFHAGATGAPYVTCNTDASSGDTNSLQDDESSFHRGSLQWRNMDYVSTGDFDRRLPYDAGVVSAKGNMKKKVNNQRYKTAQNTANSYAPSSVKFQSHMYDPRWQVEDYLSKRPEGRQYYSNGINVANGVPHVSKKLKIMKLGMDNLPEASHVASQINNTANPTRFIKIIPNRDHGSKASKMTSSDGWSSFEDRALDFLIHDMDENWDLVSDAINSIVQFKSVHRQPGECKERHQVLNRIFGNGADSAEDSHRNMLTRIPKGSALKVLERLQRPTEEENLMEHFEKIILLMQQVHSRHRQGDSQELKPIMQPHSSHVISLSQTCVNKLSGSCLTPLDLCDSVSPNLDSITPSLSLGSHTSGLTLPNHQGSTGPSTPTSNLNSRVPGAPGRALGNNFPSSSTLNTHRDAQKYGGEQPKIQYNQVISGRNFQQPGGSVPGLLPTGIDRSGRTMPSAQMAGLNQGMPAAMSGIPRTSAPGGVATSSKNLVPNSRQGMATPVNIHPGSISGSGNLILSPHDPVQTLHPGHSMEEHKQVSDMHSQVSQGTSHTSHVSCINPSSSNVAMSSPVKQPSQPQQMSPSSHMFGKLDPSRIQASASPQQRVYALHLSKEQQPQQHMMPQQNNAISGASAASCVQSCSDIVQQNQGSAVNPVSCLQPQHHQEQAPENPPDASSSPNLPIDASLQKQNLQPRNHGSQQAKLMKSLGRGNMVMPQTPPVDNMPPSAVSTPSTNHMPDKELMQHSQGFFPANTSPTPSMIQPTNQPKLPQSLKQLPDIGNQSGMQASSNQDLSDSQQPPVHSKSTLNKAAAAADHSFTERHLEIDNATKLPHEH